MRNPPLSHPQTPIEPMRLLKRKTFWLTLLLALVAIPLYYALEAYRSRGKEKAVGIYLVHGGQSFVWIDLDEDGELVVRDGYFYTHGKFLNIQEDYSLTCDFRSGRLYIEQRGETKSQQSDSENLSLVLIPSEERAQDYDLVESSFERTFLYHPIFSNDGVFSAKFYENLFEAIKERFWTPQEAVFGEFDGEPLPCFLRRIDDERIVSYINKRLQGEFTESDLPDFRELAAEFPDDPYIQMHAMDVEANYGDVALATQLLEKWEETLRTSPDPLLREVSERAMKSVWAAQGRFEGRDLFSLLDSFGKDRKTLEEWTEVLEALLDQDSYLTFTFDLVEPISRPTDGKIEKLYREDKLNYLEALYLRSLLLAHFRLELLQGNSKNEFKTLLGIYRLGDTLNREGDLHCRLIGMACRLYAESGLFVYASSVVQNERDALRTFEGVSDLHIDGALPKIEGCEWEGYSLFLQQLHPVISVGGEAEDQVGQRKRAEERNRLANAEYDLIRMGAAAQYHRFRDGEFPDTEEDFEPLLPELPEDPFVDEPLKFIKGENGGKFTVYSVSVDGVDDRASFAYSPTNGIDSTGDILFTIEKNHHFPVPKGGLRANSATDVLNALPNGLPWDPFSKYGHPLNIYDSTANEPVRIFSLGPRTDLPLPRVLNIEAFRLGTTEKTQLEFDPFGGSPTEAQLVFYPPESDDLLGTTDVGNDISNTTDTEDFYFKDPYEIHSSIPPESNFTLGPRYSPTNGIKSEGQIWIDLPRRSGE
ncbi:MAG: hypothetical protein H6752_19695 [Candidatus Omnitrophica bacterium]|nr:hypothetical protein [Candidatus Omnitrophota bacterium]